MITLSRCSTVALVLLALVVLAAVYAQAPATSEHGAILIDTDADIPPNTPAAVAIERPDQPLLLRGRLVPWDGDQARYRLVIESSQPAPLDAESMAPLLRGRAVLYARGHGPVYRGERVDE